MITLLTNLFIAQKENTDSPGVRRAYGMIFYCSPENVLQVLSAAPLPSPLMPSTIFLMPAHP